MLELVAYDASAASRVVSWCAESEHSSEWVPVGASDADTVLASWHADPDITGYLLVREGTPVAYGELWVEEQESEAELAHLVVDPVLRRQGLGRALVERLVTTASRQGLENVTLRVRPDNHPGIACYASVGFVREGEEDEARFNAGQPAAYQWMRLG